MARTDGGPAGGRRKPVPLQPSPMERSTRLVSGGSADLSALDRGGHEVLVPDRPAPVSGALLAALFLQRRPAVDLRPAAPADGDLSPLRDGAEGLRRVQVKA